MIGLLLYLALAAQSSDANKAGFAYDDAHTIHIATNDEMRYEPYWWQANNDDNTMAVKCTFGMRGSPGECVDNKGLKVVFPVTCDDPRDGWWTNCRIVEDKRDEWVPDWAGIYRHTCPRGFYRSTEHGDCEKESTF